MHWTSVPERVLLILKETIHDQSSSGELKSKHLNGKYGQIRKKQEKSTGLEIHQTLNDVTLLMRENKSEVCNIFVGTSWQNSKLNLEIQLTTVFKSKFLCLMTKQIEGTEEV